jgi:transcriptional regulator with XRE-family HTH domain
MLLKLSRTAVGLSQVALAKKVGVSQGRIGQIESGIGTGKISFDLLLSILTALGYHYKVVMTKAA